MAEPSMFGAAIPGEGLTAELGSRPWQNPPQMAKIEDIIDYYSEKFIDPSIAGDLISIMEEEVPLTTLANSMIMTAVMEGIHTIDTGMLVSPLLIEFMETIGEQADIKYVTGLEEKPDNSILETLAATKAMQKVEEVNTDSKPMEEPKPSVEEEEQPMKKGLMARGSM